MSKNFNIHKNIYLYLKAAFSLLFPPPQNQQLHPASNLLGLSTQNAPAPTTKRSNRTTNKAPTLPPQGIEIRRRHLVRPTGRRERANSLPPQGR